MQQANEAAILDHVRRNGSVSRSDVARDLGLSPATVTRAVRRLIHTEAIREVGLGIPSLGRPPTLLEYNPRQGAVIAVDVGGTLCRVVLADLDGEVRFSSSVATHQPGRSTLESVFDAVDIALEHAGGLSTRVAALGVGVPGIVTHPGGIVTRCPNVGWVGVPVGRMLQDRFKLPVVVENDVNLAALGEAWRGAAQGMSDFAVVAIGTGIGAGIVAGGELLHGRHHAAGEVGAMVPGIASLSQAPDDTGYLEAVGAGPGIAQRAWSLAQSNPRATAFRTLDVIRAEDVFRFWHDGDPIAAAVIDELVNYVSLLAINIAAILDPEIIILGGSVGLACTDLLPTVLAQVNGRVPVPPKIAVSALGGQATLMGAISAALALVRTVENGHVGLAARSRRNNDASVALAVRSIEREA